MNMLFKQQKRNTRVAPLGISRVREFVGGNTREKAMLIQYSCKDMGLACSFMVKCETLEEVTRKAMEHVRQNHVNDFNNIVTPVEIERMERALARSTRVVAG
jgi:predicted small metal-binding protein